MDIKVHGWTKRGCVKRNQLIYGAGGVGKSTQLAQIAEWVWETQKKKSRVVNADGGGTRSAFQHLIDADIAEVWDIDLWDSQGIFSALDFATKGFWPLDPNVPNSPLQPSIREWRKCPGCGEDTGGTSFSMPSECKGCKMKFGAGQLLPVIRDRINGSEEIEFYGFEGLTAFGELMLRRLRAVDSAGGMTVKDGDTKISQPGQQHYGMAQSYIAQYVANSRALPVEYVAWTALELRSDDDGKPLYGPMLPGKKLTAQCIPWFMDVLHLDAVPKKQGTAVVKVNGMEVLERKLYLAPHFPDDNPQYKFAAKTSAPMGSGMPVVIDADMKVFFLELTKAQERAKAKIVGAK